MKRLLSIGIILLFIGMIVSSSGGFNLEKKSTKILGGKTLYVAGSGPGNYTKIQDAIDDASDGDTVFVYNGTYDENIEVDKSINLIGENRDTTVIDGGGKGGVVYLSTDWVNISEFTIQNSSYREWAAGIFIDKETQHNNITDNILTNNGEGILVMGEHHTIMHNNIFNNYNGTYSTHNCNYTIIKCNNIYLNKEYGISSSWNSNSHNHIIKRNNISSNKATGILIAGSDNNSIIGNNVTLNDYNGMSFHNCHNTTINNNIVSSNKRYGLHLYSDKSNTITNNSFINDGLYIHSSAQHKVNNNTVNGKPLIYLFNESDKTINIDAGQVLLTSCNNITIQNQHITNTDSGIILLGSNNCNITHNTLLYNLNGIFLDRLSSTEPCNYNTLSTNIINSNVNGIYLDSRPHHTNIISNIINSNINGIYFYWDANRNNITGNNISFNDENGLIIYRSDYNIITNNNIYSNKGIGINKQSGSNNLIYHNNFINNSQNAYDACYSSITWDNDAYGNYWDDYTGEDSDGDYVGDTPYPIPGRDNEDMYPLMVPYSDKNPPIIEIIRPKNAIYFFNIRIIPFFFKPIIIGPINVKVEVTDIKYEIDKVDFIVNGIGELTDTTEPYCWKWIFRSTRTNTLKIVAYNSIGNVGVVKKVVDKWL